MKFKRYYVLKSLSSLRKSQSQINLFNISRFSLTFVFKNCYWHTKSHKTMRFSNESHLNSFPLFLCFWDFFVSSLLKWLRDHRGYASTSLKGTEAKSVIIKSGCMKIIQELVGRSYCLCCKWAVVASIKNLFPSSGVPS